MSNQFKFNFAQGLYETSSTQKEELGTLRFTGDGRKFRYALNGDTALAVGAMTISPAAVANHINCSVVAAAVGDTSVSLTAGGTAVTLDQYKDGYLQINDGTGEGYSYGIDSNTACGTTGTTILKLKRPVAVALVASATSEASLIKNPYSGIVVATTTQAAIPAGIPPVVVTAAYYYWSQTAGLAICQVDGTPAVGTRLILSDAVGGNLEAENTTLDIDEPVVGWLYYTIGVDLEYKPVILSID